MSENTKAQDDVKKSLDDPMSLVDHSVSETYMTELLTKGYVSKNFNLGKSGLKFSLRTLTSKEDDAIQYYVAKNNVETLQGFSQTGQNLAMSKAVLAVSLTKLNGEDLIPKIPMSPDTSIEDISKVIEARLLRLNHVGSIIIEKLFTTYLRFTNRVGELLGEADLGEF